LVGLGALQVGEHQQLLQRLLVRCWLVLVTRAGSSSSSRGKGSNSSRGRGACR
jgi:hypothetical protein